VSSMRYRTFLWSNAAGGLCWGVLYTLLGYFVGQRVEKATGIASDVVLGLILVVIVVLLVRHRRRDKEFVGPAESQSAVPENDAAG
jgi:membrane-associated protein